MENNIKTQKIEEIQLLYPKESEKLKARLKEFKNLSPENQFKEFLFCLLTPQSNAQKCWQAVKELSQLEKFDRGRVTKILSTKTRFHHTKTQRILNSKSTWGIINPILNNKNRKHLRKEIIKHVSGYGLKESSHFLRNTGRSDNQIAILDRHILRNLYGLSLISEPKVKGPKDYLEKEQVFLNFANQINIPPDELDLLLWSKENGEIFK